MHNTRKTLKLRQWGQPAKSVGTWGVKRRGSELAGSSFSLIHLRSRAEEETAMATDKTNFSCPQPEDEERKSQREGRKI